MSAVKQESKPAVFKSLSGIEYFEFEEDFVEQNVRCIPMIVRFKLDAAGIKLKLAEWARFRPEERIELAVKECATADEIGWYKTYLQELVRSRAGHEATAMIVEKHPAWADSTEVPLQVQEKAKEFDWHISIEQWQSLSDLQRFALVKLQRPGHENKNFPKAMKEFGLIF